MSLHNEIMNVQNKDIDAAVQEYGFEHRHLSYLHGHRDARHSAAELSLKYDGYIERIEEYLKEIVDAIEVANLGKVIGKGQELIRATRREAGL